MSRQSLKNLARVLPVLAAVLFLIPSLWAGPEVTGPTMAGPEAMTPTTPMRTSTVMTYLFAIWLGMIGLCILAYGRPRKTADRPRTDSGA